MTARLVGESKSKERFLVAFDVTEKTNKIKFKGQEIPIQIGFVYEKQGDKEIRYCNNSTASITGHDPYWDDPAMEFSPEEIERIVACPRCMGTMNRLPPRSWSGTANSSRTEPPQYGPSLVFGTSYFCTRSARCVAFHDGPRIPSGAQSVDTLGASRFVRDRPRRLKCRHFDDGWGAAPAPLAKRQPKSKRLRLG